ncbi:hypothetical protein P3X46_009520 [Hevea brasiliensis]|uniref:Uncharacterized protein n=2 Tax=Hevea brasiliensis TaxID=3981 RepID=A0A6A6L791_HEVBR|nr:uncharacterized protein LOC110634334 [Hevea brasiliensis]KAF2296457.1 hypothetical protein GH714_038274 [Hevea brasiliensis]KAJ9181385.1 hypothetical protein P3X46_009520 [Hevea brasiliensis]
MPQVDLETLVSACAGVSCDRKIACETLADTNTSTNNNDDQHHQPQESETDPPEIPPDFPPESFWLSKDAEFDWFDRNAFIERKDSTKVNSHSTNLNPNVNHQSNSQRFSNLKSKASIIGLPKPQKSCFVDARRHCKPGNTRLFPKRSASTSKSDSSLIEPSSPKVSCMGRVRSKKDRNRRLRNRQRSNETETKREKPERKQKGGFFASFRAIFSATRKQKVKSGKDASQRGSLSRKSSTKKKIDIRDRLPPVERDAPPRTSVGSDGYEPAVGAEPIGLGGMKRFASGRKSESWID